MLCCGPHVCRILVPAATPRGRRHCDFSSAHTAAERGEEVCSGSQSCGAAEGCRAGLALPPAAFGSSVLTFSCRRRSASAPRRGPRFGCLQKSSGEWDCEGLGKVGSLGVDSDHFRYSEKCERRSQLFR